MSVAWWSEGKRRIRGWVSLFVCLAMGLGELPASQHAHCAQTKEGKKKHLHSNVWEADCAEDDGRVPVRPARATW